MAKQHKIMASGVTGAGAAAARAVETVADHPQPSDAVAETAAPSSVPEHAQIALLAYSYWQARGAPDGSPEEDWFRAQAELGRPAVRRAP
jgi:DUF2934 family protein